MIRVGLTGGIASGKTFACGLLEAKGCKIIDADVVAHELLLQGEAGYEPVLNAFGPAVLGAHEEIDRKKLGALAFSDRALLDKLNSILHPEVFRVVSCRLDDFEREKPDARVIVDASLMIESGFHKSFQRLILVTCTLEQQIERLRTRNGLSEEQVRQRIALQVPLEDKLQFADHIIDNSGSLEDTRAQVDTLFQTLERTVWTMSQ